MTYKSPEWDPGSTRFAEQEAAMLDYTSRRIKDSVTQQRYLSIANTLPSCGQPKEDFGSALQRMVHLQSMIMMKPRHAFDPMQLSKNWNIGLKTANRTLDATCNVDCKLCYI
jgi:hypothetical protein